MATISELLLVIEEAVRAQDLVTPERKQWFVISAQIEDALWKIKSGRMQDISVDDSLRWKEINKPKLE